MDGLVNLETKAEREFITVDGERFELRTMHEFALIDRHHLAAAGRAMESIARLGDESITDEELQKAVDGLNQVFNGVVIGADEIADKLTDQQKLDVVAAFFVRAGNRPRETTTKS